jgi:hypothetical protein
MFYIYVIGNCHVPREWSNVFVNITNKTQRYAIFFITVNALHVSGGFSAHHQDLKICTHSLLAATFGGSSKQAVCTVFEFLIMGGETA